MNIIKTINQTTGDINKDWGFEGFEWFPYENFNILYCNTNDESLYPIANIVTINDMPNWPLVNTMRTLDSWAKNIETVLIGTAYGEFVYIVVGIVLKVIG
jgi:hypothetical protein